MGLVWDAIFWGCSVLICTVLASWQLCWLSDLLGMKDMPHGALSKKCPTFCLCPDCGFSESHPHVLDNFKYVAKEKVTWFRQIFFSWVQGCLQSMAFWRMKQLL